MELSHTFTVPVPVEEAWAHFQDISSVGECFPGAQVSSVEGDTFTGSVKVKLGPIALVYNGTGTFTEKDDTAHRFVVDAKGKDKRGNGTAGATVTLAMTPSGDSTDVKVDTDLAITGKPAQFGRGVMQDVSDKLLGQFVSCLEQRMGSGSVAAASTDTATEPAAPAEPAASADPADPAAPSGAADEATDAVTPDLAAPAPAAPAPASTAPASTAPASTPSAPRLAAPTPSPTGSGSARVSDEPLDLGATVLPVLAKAYWKQALGAVGVVAVLVWIFTR